MVKDGMDMGQWVTMYATGVWNDRMGTLISSSRRGLFSLYYNCPPMFHTIDRTNMEHPVSGIFSTGEIKIAVCEDGQSHSSHTKLSAQPRTSIYIYKVFMPMQLPCEYRPAPQWASLMLL